MSADELACWLEEQGATSAITQMVGELRRQLPPGASLHDDTWNILPWLKRVRNSSAANLHFSVIQDPDLKMLCKAWVLHARLTGRLSSHSAAFYRVKTFEALSRVLDVRPIKSLKTDDFVTGERWLREKYQPSTMYRLAGWLQQASAWLAISFGMRLGYRNGLTPPAAYGRRGTEAGREEKLIPTEIIRDLVNARHREDLAAKDKFYLAVLAISIGSGFRVGELALLPADCLLKMNGGLYLLHYPEKGGKPVPRPIHPLLAAVVEDAVNNILRMTSRAREVAKQMRKQRAPDWDRIVRNNNALCYFAAQWAHRWTSDPTHLMINPDGAWYARGKSFIDAIAAFEAAGRNQSQASKQLGISRPTFSDLLATQRAAQRGELPTVRNSKSRGAIRGTWDTDQRMISIEKFQRHCGRALKAGRRKLVQEIINKAKALQLQGKALPAPMLDRALEASFQRRIRPLLRTKGGKAVLWQDDALLVIQKYGLSEQRSTVPDDFSSLTDKSIQRWLTGEARSRGTGNHEDSVFIRLKIIDPRTDEVAKFTIHDIRHWLNTIYQNGGLTEDQIALIFNRRHMQQNATYDQTSNKVRLARLKQAVRDKIAVGQVTESYHRLADFSRNDAEDYLAATLRMINPMPHGICTLGWATNPCPHHLSCFSCNDQRPCEHLVIDPADKKTKAELERMQHESDLVMAAIESQGVEDSPTVDHFKRIRRNVGTTLSQMQKINDNSETNG